MTARHRLAVEARVGSVQLSVELELSRPWTVIFGPSGSGKSSLLRAACGLLPEATVRFETLRSGEWRRLDGLPVHRRRLAYSPQGAAVFPHMCVRENVAFGGGGTELVREALALFELAEMQERMPQELSGGERQRVALARAFAVADTDLCLLDEPFTGVDRRMRSMLLPRMRERLEQRGVPVVSVTHDVEETLLLEAEVVRMEAGRVTAQGPARVVLAEDCARMMEVLWRGDAVEG